MSLGLIVLLILPSDNMSFSLRLGPFLCPKPAVTGRPLTILLLNRKGGRETRSHGQREEQVGSFEMHNTCSDPIRVRTRRSGRSRAPRGQAGPR